MVVVISLDAFGAESLQDPNVPAPTLRALMAAGTSARSMQPINPTVTWPNHTAMVTGVDASRHFVMANGLITGQRTPAGSPAVLFPSTKTDLVHAPTVYDLAHAAGLTTAEIDWVAIHQASTIDFAFEERPQIASVVVQEMLAAGSLKEADVTGFSRMSQVRRDQFYTAAALHILRRHHPNLLLLHYLALDTVEHATGFGSQADFAAIGFLDAQVSQVLEAVRQAGDLDRTTFFIVSDHGQMSATHAIHPASMLRAAGVSPAEADTLPEGGVAYIYARSASPERMAAIGKIFAGKEGIDSVVAPSGYAPLGIAAPSRNPQAPDLLVFARPGYLMTAAPAGKSAPTVETLPAPAGGHGFLNTQPLMQQIFIASGRGIRTQPQIEPISVLDLAPTIASLLHLRLPDAQGHPLQQILK